MANSSKLEQIHSVAVAKFKLIASEAIGKDALPKKLDDALQSYVTDQIEATDQRRRPLSVLETLVRGEIQALADEVGNAGLLISAWNGYKNTVNEQLGVTASLSGGGGR